MDILEKFLRFSRIFGESLQNKFNQPAYVASIQILYLRIGLIISLSKMHSSSDTKLIKWTVHWWKQILMSNKEIETHECGGL